MSRQLKTNAFITFVLAVVFYLFFQISKHQPTLMQMNAFSEDPYDAVGSFGVQLAIFTALLSLVRALRPYQPDKVLDSQKVLLVRGEYISCLSIIVTLVADAVAMVRHPSIWIGTAAGYTLVTVLGVILLLTVFVGWLIHHSTQHFLMQKPQRKERVTRAVVIAIVGILILTFYPENWRQSIHGELFTVLVGASLLLVPVWAIENAIPLDLKIHFEDFGDDLTSVYDWLKAHAGPFVVLCTLFEKILDWHVVRSVLSWLNPRKHIWNVAILLGIVLGIVLALVEIFGEGGGSHKIGLLAGIAGIFIGLECSAVLLGYALLAKPLGLFRQDRLGTVK